MNKTLHLKTAAKVSFIVALFGMIAFNQASASDAPAKRGAKPLGILPVPEVAIPRSEFTVPALPSDGRNPFFPQSTPARVPLPPSSKDPTVDTTSIVLNGITSPPKRTAMINGRTFEPGEEGEVRIPSGGKMLIKVEEIKAESAIILVGGVRRELRLRAGV